MQEKIFVLHGTHIEHLGVGVPGKEKQLFSVSNLEKYGFEVVVIGNEQDGVDITTLNAAFEPHISGATVLSPINIFIQMHGLLVDGTYMLSADHEHKPAHEVISSIVQATKGHPLKILSLACFGANLQDQLDLLPNGSVIMTLSDRDRPGNSYDMTSLKIPQVLEGVIKEEGFKFEYLFEAFLFTQKFSLHTPMIGIKNNDGETIVQTMQDLTKKYLMNKVGEFSPFISKLCEIYPDFSSHIDAILQEVKEHDGDIAHLLCKEDAVALVVENVKKGSLAEFLKSHEAEYYFPGGLRDLQISDIDFDESTPPSTISSTNFNTINLSIYAHMKHWVDTSEIASREGREFLALREKDSLLPEENARLSQVYAMPEIQLWRSFVGISSFLGVDENGCLSNMQITFLDERNFKLHPRDDSLYKVEIDPTLEINEALPRYTVCMGLVFDEFLHQDYHL